MKKIMLLATANMRRVKGQMAILLILFLVAATLLNIGLTVMMGFPNHLSETAAKLNTSDAYLVVSQHLWSDGVAELLEEEVLEYQKNQAIFIFAEIPWGEGTLPLNMVISDADEEREISDWKIVGDSLPMTADGIYVPFFFAVNGYELGDTLILDFEEQELSFTIVGFTESIYTDLMGAALKGFVPSARLSQLSEELPEVLTYLVYVNGVENLAELEFLLQEQAMPYMNQGYGFDNIHGISFEQIQANRTVMATMLSVNMVVFTLVIAIVSLLVIRFRIKNSLEEDMSQIGSLQAIGYTSGQIQASFIIQYASVILLSALLSVVPAYHLLPLISQVFATQSGLYWQPGFDVGVNLFTVFGLVIIVALAVCFAARGLRKITPVLALRGGVSTHSFKRNPLPLERSPLPIQLSLACKSFLQSIRQSMMMFFILLAIGFTAVAALVVFYNSAINISAFEQVPGIERANAGIIFRPEEDIEELRAEVMAHPDVYDSQFLDMLQLMVSDTFTRAMVMEDYERRVTNNVYEGIFPRYDNEIAIAGLLAAQLEVGIGDEVLLGRDEEPFIVTGLTQGMEAGTPLTVYLTSDGAYRVESNFSKMHLAVYLYPDTDAALFIEEMEEQFGDYVFGIGDIDAAFAEGVDGFASVMSLIGVIILIISVFVVFLVLYFVIGATIVRRHRDLGIQKAIGYTTKDLMNQMTIALSLPVLLGTIAGTALGVRLINPVMGIGMAGMGVMQGNFLININWIIIAAIAIVVLAYLISMMITWRIRKISAYRLVTE